VAVAVFHRIGVPDPGTFTNSMDQIRGFSGEKTFDGIYTSVWDHRDEIAKLDGDVWLFAAGDTIGKEGFITHHQLLTLAHEYGCRLGWHTWSHPDMRTLSDDEVRRELDCPDWMPRDAFAYPYGDFDERVVGLVREAGYGKAYSTTQGNGSDFAIYRAYI
jgi:peptidoglycan/xylan/chitin deacetylase (PgdA/CDA1 family)